MAGNHFSDQAEHIITQIKAYPNNPDLAVAIANVNANLAVASELRAINEKLANWKQ